MQKDKDEATEDEAEDEAEAAELKRLGRFYVNMLSERNCARCLQPIRRSVVDDATINALGSFWHSRCFVCHMCAQPIASSGFTLIDEEVRALPPCPTNPTQTARAAQISHQKKSQISISNPNFSASFSG